MAKAKQSTLNDEIAELEREIVMRERVYPKWVESGKLKDYEAEGQLGAMVSACNRLKTLRYLLNT